MQGIIDRLQEELAMMRAGRVSETVEDADDEAMVAGQPHKKSRVAQYTSRSQWWLVAHNTACHHRRARERVPVKDRAARCGLRGTRVGEASHPGPRRRQVIPSTDDDLDSTFLDEFELDLNAPTDSRRSPRPHEQMSPCCPTAPEAFVLSDDEHMRTPAPSVCVPTNVTTVPAASGELREARRAFLPDSGGPPTSIDMCTSPEHERSHQLRGNRFAVLSREEDFPHGQAGQGVPRRRLVLADMESGVVRPSVHTLSNTGSDTESWVRLGRGHEEADFRSIGMFRQLIDFLMRDLARRIGFVPAGGPLLRPLVSHERPIDVGRSRDRSVHTCVGLVGGGPRGNSRSVGIPRRVHRTQRSSSSRVGFIASGHAELGHFSCRRFDDLVAGERVASNSKR